MDTGCWGLDMEALPTPRLPDCFIQAGPKRGWILGAGYSAFGFRSTANEPRSPPPSCQPSSVNRQLFGVLRIRSQLRQHFICFGQLLLFEQAQKLYL
jgi:hypothetical protein